MLESTRVTWASIANEFHFADAAPGPYRGIHFTDLRPGILEVATSNFPIRGTDLYLLSDSPMPANAIEVALVENAPRSVMNQHETCWKLDVRRHRFVVQSHRTVVGTTADVFGLLDADERDVVAPHELPRNFAGAGLADLDASDPGRASDRHGYPQ